MASVRSLLVVPIGRPRSLSKQEVPGAYLGLGFEVLWDFEVEVLLVLEYSVFFGGGDRLLLLLLPFDEETVELLFFFASSASSAGAKDFTIAFKVSLSAIEESSGDDMSFIARSSLLLDLCCLEGLLRRGLERRGDLLL